MNLDVAHCIDALCASPAELTSVNDGGPPNDNVGQYSSLAIGTDGNPVISYYNATTQDLEVARCNDSACAGRNEQLSVVAGASSNAGWSSSLAIAPDGNPVISYGDFGMPTSNLKVVHCNDPACEGGSEQSNVVAPVGTGNNLRSSIAIGTDGNPVISYYNAGTNTLQVALCNDPDCAGGNEQLKTPDPTPGAGRFSAVAIGSDGNPIVSYVRPPGIGIVHCNNPACTSAQANTAVPAAAGSNDLVVGTDGYPVVAYTNAINGNVEVMHCNDLACAGSNEQVSLVEANPVSSDLSMAIGADGIPVVAYRAKAVASELKVGRAAFPG